MKKWLVLGWLLIPVALLSYHFGPGQDALAYRQAREHLAEAQRLENEGHFEEAIDVYAESLAALPVVDQPSADLRVARDQLRLAQVRGRFRLGRLAETIESLNILDADVDAEHGQRTTMQIGFPIISTAPKRRWSNSERVRLPTRHRFRTSVART